MLYFLVACAAAQLGGEETDGYVGGPPLDSGIAADTTNGETGMSSPSTRAGAERAPGDELEVLGMVGGVAVTDYGVRATDCASLDFGEASEDVDAAGRVLLIGYGLPTPSGTPEPCVVSWTYFGLEAGVWTLDVDGRTTTFDVL